MEENFVYQLESSLKYTKNGDFSETATIEMSAPNMKCFDESSDFEQLLMGAMISASKASKSGKEETEEKEEASGPQKQITPAEVKTLLYISQDIKMKDIAKAFRKIAVKSAKLDESTKMINDHFDKLSKNDFVGLLCGYASFFTFPSLLSEG